MACAVTGGTSATLSAISRRGRELIARHDLVDEAEPVGFFGIERLRAQEELLGFARPDLPRLDEQLDADAGHARDRVRELGVVGRDDEVAHGGEHQPGRGAGALHRGDRRLAEVAQPHALVPVHDLLVPQLALGGVAHPRPLIGAGEQLFEVVPGREVLSFAREHEHPDVVIGVDQIECGVELLEHPGVLRVGRLRAVQRDRRDGTIDLVADGLERSGG